MAHREILLLSQEPAQGLCFDLYVVLVCDVPAHLLDGECEHTDWYDARSVCHLWRDTLPNGDGARQGDDLSVCDYSLGGYQRSGTQHLVCGADCGQRPYHRHHNGPRGPYALEAHLDQAGSL